MTTVSVRLAGRLKNDRFFACGAREFGLDAPQNPGTLWSQMMRDARLAIREIAAALGCQIVMATPPFLWPPPTYVCASAIFSSG
jgi:hypothetical protein